jgi:flagellar biosynthetic protein FliQ
MTIDNVTTILNDGIQTIIITSLPSVGVGLVVGLIIALFQAVTQIQEQTLTFVPKMVTVFLILAATFPWMAGTIIEMTTNLWIQIPVYSR